MLDAKDVVQRRRNNITENHHHNTVTCRIFKVSRQTVLDYSEVITDVVNICHRLAVPDDWNEIDGYFGMLSIECRVFDYPVSSARANTDEALIESLVISLLKVAQSNKKLVFNTVGEPTTIRFTWWKHG